MDAASSPALPAILQLLDAPKDGRLLAFGASTSEAALGVAVERPDLLIVLCDATSEVTRSVSDRVVADRIYNVIVGDTHAGPPVDRALSIGAMSTMGPSEYVAMRTAMLPGGYAIFIEEGGDGSAAVASLKGFGFTVADALDSPIPGHYVIRAR